MISYKKCTDVDPGLVYEAFNIGFSDYIIKTSITKEDFVKRFFGPEGNSMENSFAALDNNKGIGVILGGIKTYEGIKTIRCGALAVSPKYRGMGVSDKLLELHKEEALKNGCRQLFLEVIVGNDRAINFYKRHGYEKIYDLSYFSMGDLSDLKISNISEAGIEVRPISFDEFSKTVNERRYFHINWQNDLEYLEKSIGMTYYGAFMNDIIVGCICMSSIGKICFLNVDREYRGRGAALKLLAAAIRELKLEKLAISFPNNSLLEGFVRHVGFRRDPIAQYEMFNYALA